MNAQGSELLDCGFSGPASFSSLVSAKDSPCNGADSSTLTTRLPRPPKDASKAAFTPRLSVSSVERLANQRLHLARNEVSDWLDARR
ncbi:hypothetical protein TNCV_1755961 [Trichonephila clavipes]|nr:hypothetical protein TNCV_1755961 [Trichonephila clavipes]